MPRTLRLRFGGAAAAAIILLGVPAASIASAAQPPPPTAFVDGTESMPPPPTGAKAERLATLNAEPPTIESAGDISATVVTHTVWTRIVADEEWRSFYGTAWATEAQSRVETADNALFSQFGIDFRNFFTGTWTTSPNTARGICNILSELQADIPLGDADVVSGFTNNAVTGSSHGCAGGNHEVVHLHGSTTAQRVYNVWVTVQHEYSHFFGAPDRYPDPNNLHTNDVMEDHYNFPSIWCTQAGYNDWGIVNSNRAKYG